MLGEFPHGSRERTEFERVARHPEPVALLADLPALEELVATRTASVDQAARRQHEFVGRIQADVQSRYPQLWNRWLSIETSITSRTPGVDTAPIFRGWIRGVASAVDCALPKLRSRMIELTHPPEPKRFLRREVAPIDSMGTAELAELVSAAFSGQTTAVEGADGAYYGQGRASVAAFMKLIPQDRQNPREFLETAYNLVFEMSEAATGWLEMGRSAGNPHAVSDGRAHLEVLTTVLEACRTAWREIAPGITPAQMAPALEGMRSLGGPAGRGAGAGHSVA